MLLFRGTLLAWFSDMVTEDSGCKTRAHWLALSEHGGSIQPQREGGALAGVESTGEAPPRAANDKKQRTLITDLSGVD